MYSFSQKIVNWIASVLEKLPTDPFAEYLQQDDTYLDFLGTLNYFVPVGTLITITGAWLACIAIYYLVAIALRWVKAL